MGKDPSDGGLTGTGGGPIALDLAYLMPKTLQVQIRAKRKDIQGPFSLRSFVEKSQKGANW